MTSSPDDVARLVERLRAGASRSTDIGAHLNKYQALCDEAADELARLRSALAAEKVRGDEAAARLAEVEKALVWARDAIVAGGISAEHDAFLILNNALLRPAPPASAPDKGEGR